MFFEAQSEEQPLTPEQDAQLRQIVVDRAPAELAAVDAATTDEEVFYALPSAAYAAFHLEQFDLAGKLAQRALLMAQAYRGNWNYGNAIHAGHTVLGLLALRGGDLLTATARLKDSGETPGSPQLGSFGPTMYLAKELLKRGHFEPVREYFRQCREFWKMGDTWLEIWNKKIDAGEIPNFFFHCYR